MSELPTGWCYAPLRDIASKIGSGATPTGGKTSYKTGGIPLIRSMNVHFSGFSSDGLAFIDDEQAKKLDGVLVQPHDVLLNITGASIGRVTTAPSDMDGARVNQHVAIVRTVDGIEGRFVAGFLSCPHMQRIIAEENYGVTRQALTKSMIEEFSVPLPPLPEQRRIVAKIDSLSAKSKRARDHLDHIPRLVEKYKQAILAAAFAGEITREWRKDQRLPAWTNSTVEMAASLIFDGPFGSNLKSADYSEDGTRVVRLENIGYLQFVMDKETFISKAKYETLRRHTLEPGDILFSSFVADEIRVCLLPELPTTAINKADCFCIRVDRTRCDPMFLTYRLASRSTFEQLEEIIHGATRPRISLAQLKAFEFELPTLEEQQELVARIQTAFAWIDRLASQATSARKLIGHLDQAILAKAFRGELVPQDPADEPAGVLLDRIRAGRSAAAPAPTRGRRPRSGAGERARASKTTES